MNKKLVRETENALFTVPPDEAMDRLTDWIKSSLAPQATVVMVIVNGDAGASIGISRAGVIDADTKAAILESAVDGMRNHSLHSKAYESRGTRGN